MKNNTWKLEELPKGRKAITNKWLFRRKFNPDGSVSRYKARLVVRGFSQVPGLDYDETFAPVIKFPTIRMVMALVAFYNLEFEQMDVTIAFLNGVIDEEIFMQQPPGYEVKGKENLVCRLLRALYGLKHSPRRWSIHLDEFLRSCGFTRATCDPILYIYKEGNQFMLLLV